MSQFEEYNRNRVFGEKGPNLFHMKIYQPGDECVITITEDGEYTCSISNTSTEYILDNLKKNFRKEENTSYRLFCNYAGITNCSAKYAVGLKLNKMYLHTVEIKNGDDVKVTSDFEKLPYVFINESDNLFKSGVIMVPNFTHTLFSVNTTPAYIESRRKEEKRINKILECIHKKDLFLFDEFDIDGPGYGILCYPYGIGADYVDAERHLNSMFKITKPILTNIKTTHVPNSGKNIKRELTPYEDLLLNSLTKRYFTEKYFSTFNEDYKLPLSYNSIAIFLSKSWDNINTNGNFLVDKSNLNLEVIKRKHNMLGAEFFRNKIATSVTVG